MDNSLLAPQTGSYPTSAALQRKCSRWWAWMSREPQCPTENEKWSCTHREGWAAPGKPEGEPSLGRWRGDLGQLAATRLTVTRGPGHQLLCDLG